jgi:hypothetical protein
VYWRSWRSWRTTIRLCVCPISKSWSAYSSLLTTPGNTVLYNGVNQVRYFPHGPFLILIRATGAEFIKASNDFSSKLACAVRGGGSMSTQYCQLLDILAQLACQAALGHTKEPHADASVPADLKGLLTVLRDLYTSYPGYQSFGIAPSCTRQLIFVARKEPGILPKPLAHAMVHQIEPGLLLQQLRSTTNAEALDLSSVDVTHIESAEFRQSSHRTTAALDCLIQPHLFPRVLDVYESCHNDGTLRQPSLITSALLGGVGQWTAQAGLAFVYNSV